MKYTIHPIMEDGRIPIIDIFNYYVENSFAAYPDAKVPYEAFDTFRQLSEGYPSGVIKMQNGTIVGFGMLRSYNPISVFSQTAEVTYFLHPDYTGKGLGIMLLEFFEYHGREKGITNILASISSRNPRSIAFHKKNGFVKCGCFKNAGKKRGQLIDVVWMQKTIQ